MSSRARKNQGFTLLEVMLAVAIMAIALGAVFSAQAGSMKMATRARKLGFANLLTRCKMGEIEEDLAKKGLPTILQTDSDKCCKDAPIEGFKCKWEISPIILPDTMFGSEDEKNGKKSGTGTGTGATSPLGGPSTGSSPLGGLSGLGSGSSSSKSGLSGLLGAASSLLGGNKTEGPDGKLPESLKDKDGKELTKDKDGKTIDKRNPDDLLKTDPAGLLAGGGGNEVDGLTAMAMQFVYPVLKPSFQGQIRRVTVTVSWSEGEAPKTMDVTQYIVAEQPVPLATDPNNPNAALGGVGTTGTTGLGTTGLGSSSTLGTRSSP
jgi:prepilin-type N-terminal cleavage/methylation domain-containing protein